MTAVTYRAFEYGADESLTLADFRIDGTTESGWVVERNGERILELGPGYRLMRSLACGVCSTDLARHFLPFPLPQVTGHEVVVTDLVGEGRYVVEINASHAARGLDTDCAFCRSGLERHCPERLVLGIHDLPGGFGPFVLAPVQAILPLPERVPTGTAVLIEPFAAALNAVDTVRPRQGDRVAVLGPRRLGLLVVAALAARRRASSIGYRIVALTRHAELAERARALGADEASVFAGEGDELVSSLADVVVDTTGSPTALELALRLAGREVHVKSTHGRPSGGLTKLTEMVVDELSLGPLSGFEGAELAGPVAWLADGAPPAWLARRTELVRGTAYEARRALECRPGTRGAVPRFALAVADDAAGVDAAVRPGDDEVSLVVPRGSIAVTDALPTGESAILDAVRNRELTLSTSRCGDFRAALELLSDPELIDLGNAFVTHRFAGEELPEAFRAARKPDAVKAIVTHPAAARSPF